MDPPSAPVIGDSVLAGARDLFSKHSVAFLEDTEPAECERLALLVAETDRDVFSPQTVPPSYLHCNFLNSLFGL